VVQRGRDEAIAELERAHSELESTLETLRATATERDSAIRAGIDVERELRAANTQRTTLRKEHEQLVAQRDLLRAEVKRLTLRPKEVRADPQQNPARQAQPVLPAQQLSPSFSWRHADDWQRSTRPGLRSRALAILAVAGAVVLVLLILVLRVF
jgi:hypothetical protein